jgi:hypothetical protein
MRLAHREADSMDNSLTIIAERIRPAIESLVTAFNYAEDSHTDRGQFAIGITELQAIGATLADLRWLILRGFAEHGRETTIPGDAERSFRRLVPTAFPIETCFVMSAVGAANFRKVLHRGRITTGSVESRPAPAAAGDVEILVDSRVTPDWDPIRRELRYRGKVIKRYRVPAQNQELILTAFQESGWPECIDDPLPPSLDQDSKERLQTTIKSLNCSQLSRALRFHGNGDGQQVYWQAAVPAKTKGAASRVR